MESASQIIRDNGMNDMQAEPRAAAIAACREERIEGLAPDVKAHAAAVVGKKDINGVVTGSLDLDVDRTSAAIGKGVCDRIEEEIGQQLSVWSRVAVDPQIGLARDVQGQVLLSQARPQAHDNLFR